MKVSNLIGAIAILLYSAILVAICMAAFVAAVNEDACRVKGGIYTKSANGWNCLKVERQ